MKPTQFCYWLQGFFEVTKPYNLTPAQLKQIKQHLALVFTKMPKKSKKPRACYTKEPEYCSGIGMRICSP